MPSTLPQNIPPYRLSRFSGHPDTLRAMVRAVQGPRGEQSYLVREVLEDIIRDVQPKDYLGEILAVRYWVAEHVHYVNDPLHVEMVKDPQRIVEEILRTGKAIEDCDGYTVLNSCFALLLGRVSEACVVGFGAAGQYAHVFSRVQEPRTNQWIVCDQVAGTDERGMLDAITTYYTVSFDEPPERIAA